MEWLIIWVLFGIGAAIIASNKGASGGLWFFLGILFGPFALLFALFQGKECPHCKSKIHEEAKVCPKCQREVGAAPEKAEHADGGQEDFWWAQEAPSRPMSKRWILVLAGIVVALWVVFTINATDSAKGVETGYMGGTPTSPPPSAPSYSARAITTADATYDIPGVAFMDGTDPKATSPATLMTITLWDNAPRTRPIATLRHGTQVDLLEAREVASERRYYFHVRANGVEGWLPESFLSPYRKDPIGDQF